MLARYSISNCFKPCSASFRLYATSNTYRNPNQGIIDQLQRDKETEEKSPVKNPFKIVALAKAIKAISNVEDPIRSGTGVMGLPGVGPRIIARIDQYLCSNKDSSEDPETQSEVRKSRALSVLQGVPGIGLVKAKKLVDAGCMSISDLHTNKFASILTKAQIARFKYLGFEGCKTSRQEAKDVLRFCRGSLDSKCELTLVGDYRRGAASFTDIRLMISHPDYVHLPLPTELPAETVPRKRGRPSAYSLKNNLLHNDVIPLLQKRGLVAESLSVNPISWQGIVRLPDIVEPLASSAERMTEIQEISGQYRIMQITIVPQKSRGANLLYLTGDSAFEKNMSDAAKRLNLHLNNHGLWSWHSNDNGSLKDTFEGSGSSSSGHWRLVKSATEHDIFEELGMDFIEPEKRNFLFVSGKRRQKSTVIPD